MSNYIITKSTDDEYDIVNNGIVEYNMSKVPFTQDPPFVSINRVMKDSNGDIMAGVNSMLYCWNCLYIDILWVNEAHRTKGYGSILMKEVEEVAKEKGCHLIHLDTFDFQAKDFYIKLGFEVFGVLEDNPEGHTRYFMKKKI